MVTTYIYYNMDTKQICDSSGVSITNRPEISFGGNPTWIIYLIDEKGYAWSTTGITSWKAAVAFDFDSDTAPACRTVSSDITFSGCQVTVPINSNTTSFLNAVRGRETTYGWFELSGFDTDGNRICYLIFPIIGRMILDPDTTEALSTPSAVSVNWSDINGKPTIPAGTFEITATPESSGAITGTFNKTAAEMRSAIAAGKDLIVKLTSSGTVYTYHLFYVTDSTDTLTIGFYRSISGTTAPSDEVMEWYSDSSSYNIHERASEEAFRLYLMPTASSAYANKIYQYCGVTNENYTEGHFYKITGTEGSYTWQEVSLSGNAASVSISDSGSYFTSTHVEGALQEIGATLSGLQSALEAI